MLEVTADGLEPVRLPVQSIQKDVKGVTSAKVSTADLITLTRQWEENIRQELELAALSTQVPVLVRVYLSLFPDLMEDATQFDLAVVAAANEARRNKINGSGLVRFTLVGPDSGPALAHLSALDIKYPHSGISGAFILNDNIPSTGFQVVDLAPASEIIQGGQLQIPATPLKSGDIGTLALSVVVATPRTSFGENGEVMDPHYLAAARLATANDNLMPGEWASIVWGHASLSLRIKNAIKPLMRILENFNQWSKIRLATLTAA
jgi:hypothetical protein